MNNLKKKKSCPQALRKLKIVFFLSFSHPQGPTKTGNHGLSICLPPAEPYKNIKLYFYKFSLSARPSNRILCLHRALVQKTSHYIIGWGLTETKTIKTQNSWTSKRPVFLVGQVQYSPIYNHPDSFNTDIMYLLLKNVFLVSIPIGLLWYY